MKFISIYTLLFFVFVFSSCELEEPSTPFIEIEETTSNETEEIITEPEEEAETGCVSDCFPPFTADTSCIQMQMLLDGFAYKPMANYSCIIPSIFLGIDQLWINGSTPIGLRVVSLLMPTDVESGTYPLTQGTAYTAFYVPSSNSGTFVTISGTLTIAEHDMVNRHITGGFEVTTQNLESPILPTAIFEEGCFDAHY